jgi:hypothetical protein
MDTMVQLSVRVPRSIWKAAKLDAVEQGIPLNEWIANALTEHLRSPERPGGLVGGSAGGGAPTGGRR